MVSRFVAGACFAALVCAVAFASSARADPLGFELNTGTGGVCQEGTCPATALGFGDSATLPVSILTTATNGDTDTYQISGTIEASNVSGPSNSENLTITYEGQLVGGVLRPILSAGTDQIDLVAYSDFLASSDTVPLARTISGTFGPLDNAGILNATTAAVTVNPGFAQAVSFGPFVAAGTQVFTPSGSVVPLPTPFSQTQSFVGEPNGVGELNQSVDYSTVFGADSYPGAFITFNSTQVATSPTPPPPAPPPPPPASPPPASPPPEPTPPPMPLFSEAVKEDASTLSSLATKASYLFSVANTIISPFSLFNPAYLIPTTATIATFVIGSSSHPATVTSNVTAANALFTIQTIFFSDLAEGNTLGAGLGILSLAFDGIGILANVVSGDPPDPNFLTVATLTPPVFNTSTITDPTVLILIRITQDLDAYEAAVALAVTASERYQGAVLAGNKDAAALQYEAFQTEQGIIEQTAAIASADLDMLPGLLSVAGLPVNADMDQAVDGFFMQLQQEISQNGLPNDLIALLNEALFSMLGVTPDDAVIALEEFNPSAFTDIADLPGELLAVGDEVDFNEAAVSEPSTLLLFSTGLLCCVIVVAYRRRHLILYGTIRGSNETASLEYGVEYSIHGNLCAVGGDRSDNIAKTAGESRL
jgi:hypothetical protein